MEETSSSSDEEFNETAAAMEEINAEDEEINAEDEEINAEDLNGGDDNEEGFEPIDIDENEPEEEADGIVVENQESLMKFENKASNAAKIVQLLKNLLSVEVKIYSEASKEFVKLLKSDSGSELLYEYVKSSPACAELVKAWEMRKGKRGGEHVLSLIKLVLSHPDGMFKSNDIGRITISRRLDKFAQYIITTKLDDVYAELNSKEEKNQKEVLLLLAAVVRRGVGLASELAKRFNFKLPIFPKLAEYGKKGAYVTRRSFIEFAMSFMEIGNPRLLRWILQQKDMYSGILCGLGSDDDETVVHVLSILQDRVLTPDSLVPPGLRSVLFGSLTLKQLKNISEDVGASVSIAHEVLIKVCTDPQNGLMPDMNAHTAPLKGNRKRLSDLMKKLKPADIRCHRDLVLAIVSRDPTFASSYMDEFPFNLEPRTSPTWFDAISLAADVVSSASTSCYFGSLVSRPSVYNSEAQCLLKCIIPRSFSRVIINRGLLHSDALVRHSSLRFLLEGLKSLDHLLDIIDSNCHSNDTMAQKWLSLKQEIQDEAKALLPDPQVLLKLLSSLRHNDSKSCDNKSKRGRKLEGDDEANAKKLKTDLVDKDIDIVIGGISTEPDDTMSSKRGNIDGTEDLKSEKECVKVIAGIWALSEYSMIGDKLKDAEIYFHSKLLDVLTFYLRTMPNALEGSFDFFKMLPSNPFTLSSNQQQSLLSLLIEYTGCSPGIGVSFRPPEVMYKYLPSLINLLIYSPVKDIQDKAYTLARAAMLSSGAFDRNLWEVDAWFLFLPGYRREALIMESQRTKVFQDLSAVVVSFFCDAVSTVGNNLYKYLDNVRHTVSNLKGLEDFTPDFSPLIICILKKCLRLMDSNSATFKLSEKSMISMYVCNALCFLLQTQVQGELLASLIDVILTERLGDCSFEDDDNSGKFLCEWRPLKNLLLFSRNLSHHQAFNSLHSITQKTLSASTHPFSRTLGKVKKTLKKAVKRECQGDLVGLATAFCSSVICTTPDEILENFPSVITISQYLLGEHLSFLASVFFLERNLLADVADRWPDIFFSGLDLVEAASPSNQKLDACFLNKTNSSEELLESTSGAFSFFLKKAPFFMLLPSIIGTGVSDSLVSDKLLHILKVKLDEGSPADCVASLRLLLFWIHQIQLSYKVKPLNELEQLSQTCFILINHILAKLLVVTSDSDSSTSIEAPVLVPYIQEAVKIIFHHPAVAISLSQPLCCNTELNYESLGDSFEDFICSSKSSIHPMDHNILHLVTSVSDYLFALANDQCAASDDHDAAKKPLVKVFKTLVQRVILIFKDKFGLCIESRDMMPLLPTYHIFHAISRFMSPFELLELVNWMFGEVDRADSKDWKSSKVSAFSIGCRIAASGFDLMSSWEVKGESFDSAFLEKVYYKVIELATVFKLESADLCLLKAVKFVYKHKRMQPKSAVFPLLAVSRVVVSSPIETIIHCIQKTTATKAKLLFLLTEVSPLHLTLFGQIFSCILDRDCPFKSNMIEEICNHAFSDENHMMLLPVASSFLDWSITKFGVQYLKTCAKIPSFYSRMLLDGFRNWKSYFSSNIFQEKHGESVPTSTEDLLNLFSGSLLGKAVHMLRYYFALNEDSMGMEKRMKLFDSIYPCVGADDELLDCDVGEINISATNHSLDILNRVVAKITFSRLLLFPKDNFIQFQLTETGEHLKEIPWGMGSNREDSPKLRFMRILVSTLHAIIRRFPLVSGNSAKSKSTDNTSLFRLLEVFILRNITELSREMQSDLIELQSLPFLEQFIRSSLLYRFEDPTTLRVLCDVLMSLSEGKFSCHVIFEMLLAHSQFIPTILWNDSISESSRVSDAGTLFKPISSILKSDVLLFDINETGEKANLQLSPLYGRKLEVIKLLRVLYHLKAHQKAVAPREDVSMNSTELLSLLLSCYGATMGDIDLEIYNLMNEIVSTEGADCLGIAEMDYLWGSAALKLRKEKMLEKVLSSNDITDCGTPEERRRRQFRESFAVDPKLCLATVLHFPYDRIACDGPTPFTKLPRDNLMHKLEAPSGKTGRIQQYDPAFILRFSIHGLSKGYLEHLEFAGLGLLAIAIMSISSPDEGIRKLGYEALGRFKNAMEDSQNRKGGLRLRLLLTYLQNGIAEPWQRIPSVIAIFAAESSVVLLDPSHDHYLTISKLLLRSPRVNLKSIPLFHTLFRSSSVNFKTDRLWILRLSYVGINLDDDAQIFMRKSLLEMLLGYYSSSLSDYESKILILQIMKKSVKLPKLALYLVEHCGLISWLSSVLCFCGEKLCDDHTNLFVKQMMIGIEVVNGVISQRRVTDFLQKHALEQLSELSSHLYKILVGSSKMIKQNVALVNLILQLLVTTLRISQKRKEFQPHFNLSYGGLFRLYKVIDEEPCNTRSVISADLVLRAILMSSPLAVISPMDREKLQSLVVWGTSIASTSDSEEMLKESDIHFTTFSGEQQCKETLISTLLRWVTASVILGNVSRKSFKINTLSSSERANIKTLQSLLENIKKDDDAGIENDYDEGRKQYQSNDIALASTILYLQQILGMNRKMLQSVVSSLCLLLLSHDSSSTGVVSLIGGDQVGLVASLCSKISCPLEANPAWRWSFDQPWKDVSLEPTDLQVVDEYQACETLLVIFSNALGGNNSLDLPVLSHRNLEESGVFAWERDILTTQLSFK